MLFLSEVASEPLELIFFDYLQPTILSSPIITCDERPAFNLAPDRTLGPRVGPWSRLYRVHRLACFPRLLFAQGPTLTTLFLADSSRVYLHYSAMSLRMAFKAACISEKVLISFSFQLGR